MKRPFRRSLADSWRGLKHAVRTERNLTIHLVLFAIALLAFFLLGARPLELVIVVLTGGLVIVAELINTAVENLIDLNTDRRYHPLAWVGKDVAAGAVLFTALLSLVVAALVLVNISLRW